ncbi:dihydrodipicolinate synthase family protein [Paenibacillus flagellatus]|uniref:N-acetylneuraminate lyase n=1 Tax=Paenibacillus flagellatus TaxID=2211139 RepID=A0A2V5KF04_9BACL|nr:dihydrodipicolinate synthase family protein [Paenibacillus flagellatus]PYI56894.1 N-acetylneuraminate lyase [Paenibacillus flagellatus]
MLQTDLSKFKGIIVAMNSCYDRNGRVDEGAVGELVAFLAKRGVKGVYVGGSTGEGMLQSVEERKRVLEAVMAAKPLDFTVIAHVGAITTRDSVELAEHAESVGADALSAIPPFYYRISEHGVEEHWASMMRASGLPFIIYHIPATTGFSLSKPLLQKMLAYPQTIGVKITTPSTYELQQFKALGGPDFLLFNGPDEQLLAGLSLGADAGIGGTYGMMPELFVAIYEAFRQGRMEEARTYQTWANDIIAELLDMPVYGAIKEIVKMRGVDCGQPRLPLEPVPADRLPAVRKLYEKMMSYVEACGAAV